MIENTFSLLPVSRDPLSVLTIGSEGESLQELDRLLYTLSVNVQERLIVKLRDIHAGTYVGKGKLEEAKALIEEKKIQAAIFDFELSPNQLRNVEKELGVACIDRPGVIIEIFSRRAQTKESKTQVELARLQYLFPRLAHYWSHFERQRGGGVGNRGMGEKQIEVDRRLVKKRMTILRDRLTEIERDRDLHRKGREDVIKVALVGYTNAGKSTLLNALTESAVLAEDKLFATLDASVRMLNPHSHPPIVAIDTVGFIRNLPHSLVASFRSTLEVVHEADLILHVLDGSSSSVQDEMKVTVEVLADLKADTKPRITVFNKSDQVTDPTIRNFARISSPGSVWISALNVDDIQKLRSLIFNHFTSEMPIYELFLPYGESRLESQLFAHGSVEKVTHHERGTFYRLRMPEAHAKKLALEKYKV